jgi:hypothetical protein
VTAIAPQSKISGNDSGEGQDREERMEKDKGESMEEDEGQTALINTQDL